MNIQNLINTQDDIIIICDKNKKVKYVNKAFYNYFKEDRIEEIKDFFFKQELDKEFKANITNYKNNNFVFLAKLTQIDNNDIVLTLKDITKLSAYKKSLLESNVLVSQYKTAIDEFAIVSKTDINGIITYVNKNFVKISGFTKDELIGKNHNIVRHPDMPNYIFKNMWETIKSGKIWKGIIKNRKKNGSYYYVKSTIVPLFDSNDNIKEFIAFRVDITDQIKAKEKAQRLAKIKSMFLANMSHEIRTPLNGIIGFIELLREEKLEPKIKQMVDTIYESSKTLIEIVNDILDISKIEAEGITLNMEKMNPKKSFTNVVELFRAKIEEKNIKYNINISVPDCIISDEHRLKQVLSNLIGNAVKFTPENGEINVEIITKEEYDNKAKIYFSVKDTGIGIPKDKQKKIFQTFSQADNSTVKKFGGTGLGLAISSKIIEKMGSNIQLESQEGKGSNFYFELEFDTCKLEYQEDISDNINFNAKILIAEDHPVNQKLIKALLETKGDIKTTLANNGQEAIEYFKKEKFDLILMDINMPKMDGIEATKYILEYEQKHRLPHTPIIALTANAMAGDKEKYLKKGFDDYLSKPIQSHLLTEVLNKFIKKFNVAKMAEDGGLDEDTFKELLNLFFETIPNDLEQLKQYINSNDLENISKAAHKIASSSSAVRFEKIYNLAKYIENMAKTNEQLNYKTLFNQLVEQIESYKKEIEDN